MEPTEAAQKIRPLSQHQQQQEPQYIQQNVTNHFLDKMNKLPNTRSHRATAKIQNNKAIRENTLNATSQNSLERA